MSLGDVTGSLASVSGTRRSLFRAKLQMPLPGSEVVRRTRLHRMLDESVDTEAVIVSAPAGSGKTQLVAAWAHDQRSPRDVAWVTLDRRDQEPARLLDYLVAAIGGTPAGHVPMAALDTRHGSHIGEDYLLAVSDAMASLEGHVVLVLDDFQAIAGSESEHLMRRVLSYPVDKVHPIVLSRGEPTLGQEKLRLAGRLSDIGELELGFTPDEVAQLLHAHGVRLDPDEVEYLLSCTRGWAAAVVLLATSLKGKADHEARTIGWGEGHARIRDYLRHEVYADQSPGVRRFLLRAATVNPVCGELADVLTGELGGERVLDELVGAHVFLNRVDELWGGNLRWYRWHPLFLALLRETMHSDHPALEAELHRAASGWLRRHGFPVEAVHHAVSGDDIESATAILGESWLDLVLAEKTDVVRGLLALFEESERAKSPELAVTCAFMRMQGRELDWALRCCDAATDLAESEPPERRLAVGVMATVVRLHAASMTGHPDDADLAATADLQLQHLSAPGRFLSEVDGRRRALLLYDLGAFEASQWKWDEPREHLNAAMAEAATLGLSDLVLRCRAQIASLDLFSGRLEAAETAAQQVIDSAESGRWRSCQCLAIAHTVLGGVDVFRGELDRGLQRLAKARRVAHRTDLVNHCRIGFLRHVALRTGARIATGRHELERLKRTLENREASPWVRMLVHVAEAEQLVSEGRSEDARRLLASIREGVSEPVAKRHGAVFQAELLLRMDRPEDARSCLVDVQGHRAWPIDVLALVIDALAADRVGAHEEALEALGRALDNAGPERIVQPFLSSGRMRSLLEEVLESGTAHEDLVLDILTRLQPQPAGGRPTPRLYVDPLTDREVEVLRAMQGTASNGEIAQRLFVSVNTLRTHMKHINRKLGTRARREAVARGRELGII